MMSLDHDFEWLKCGSILDQRYFKKAVVSLIL